MGVIFFIILAIVVFAIVGSAIMGILLHLIWWAIVGLVVGALARLVLTDGRVGLLQTMLFGLGGALLGGVIAGMLDVGWFLEFLIAVLVAAILIFVFGNTSRRSGSSVTPTR
jgi:uncharacterized membrane protein YeaQ/YmgE (transglycosylase-associated protein family)